MKRCISDGCFKNTFGSLMVVWAIVSLGLAIYGAIQLSEFSQYKNHEGGIWDFGVGGCIVDFLLAVTCFIGLRSLLDDQLNNSILIPAIVLEIAVTIWAIIVYHYSRNNGYIDFWIDNAPGLMVSVYAHYAYIGIYLFLVILFSMAVLSSRG